jgi:DNA-binding protein H-NS
MSNPQRRLVAIADTTANLIAQLRELNELREQVRKAELSARELRSISRMKTFGPRAAVDKSNENCLQR